VDYGYLLGVAPLTAASRSALMTVIAHTRDIGRCGTRRDRRGQLLPTFCAASAGERVVVFYHQGGAVTEIAWWLLRRSRLLPGIARGTLYQWSYFGSVHTNGCLAGKRPSCAI
jgi:hypothetical protein